MSGKITVQELGMFLGTGLMMVNHSGDTHKMTGVDNVGGHDSIKFGAVSHTGAIENWRPIMRSLASITREEWLAMGLWKSEWSVFKNAAYRIPEALRYTTARALADRHYNIFNWMEVIDLLELGL